MLYSIREGLAGLVRAKIASTITISVISLSLLVVGFFLTFIFNATRLIDSIQNRIELEVFLDNSITDEKQQSLQQQIKEMDGVQQVVYISKEQAAEIFKQHFDETIFEILDENPLPASFQVSLTKGYRNSQAADEIINRIVQMDGVDDIEFRSDILAVLERYLNYVMVSVVVVGCLLIIGSIALVSNTIKLVILSRVRIIETMRLVGATKSFIRRPFVFEGVFQGAIGAGFAILIFYVIVKIVDVEIPGLIIINGYVYFMLFGLGIFLGSLGSTLAMQRFLKF